MPKQKGTKLRRPHGDLIRRLVTRILVWKPADLAERMGYSTKTVESILAGDEKSDYSMSAEVYDALVKAVNEGLSKTGKSKLDPEQFLIDYRGEYPADLRVEMPIRVASAQSAGEAHGPPPVSTSPGPKPYPVAFMFLHECYGQFSTALADVGPQEKTVIELLAYKLAQAKEYIRRLLVERPNLLDLEFRILCEHPRADGADLPHWSTDEVGNVAESFNEIRAFLKANAEQIGLGGRSLTISTRAYKELPYVGGWHVVAPERHRAHYISLNGYRLSFDGRFKWPDQYMAFSGRHAVGSAGHYFTDYYDGLFAELWRTSKPMPLYEYPFAVAAGEHAAEPSGALSN